MNSSEYKLPDHRAEQKRTGRPEEIVHGSFSLRPEEMQLGQGKTYWLRTYGCQANVRDSETIAGMLELMGFQACEHPEDADLLIFNTCAVRRAAEEHVFGEIGLLKTLKKKHPEKIFALGGCMAQEETVVNELMKHYPQVDLIFGTHNLHRLPALLSSVMHAGGRTVDVESGEGEIIEGLPVHRTSRCKGFVNIMYGCNKFCTYCIVPYTRGQERSRAKEDILAEINELKHSGRREVTLLGQNVNAYGKDLGQPDGFTDLLEAAAATGIERIRFYTSHPRDYSPATIDAMKRHANIMNALHLPVQSGDDEILRRMARGYTAEQYMHLFDEMKAKIPEITFTTDLIVGFPGETAAQFEKTLALVDYCQFDLAYTFVYSPREGTPAARMADDVPAAEKARRLQVLNAKIADCANRNNQKYLGRTLRVLCEGTSKKNAAAYSGYSEENKLVNFTGRNIQPGDIADVLITAAKSFSLDGEAVAVEDNGKKKYNKTDE